jgi:hypothetical protein
VEEALDKDAAAMAAEKKDKKVGVPGKAGASKRKR